MKDRIPLRSIGEAPLPEQVDGFLMSLSLKNKSLKKRVIGKSVQGRDLLLYELTIGSTTNTNNNTDASPTTPDIPTVLFLSLVHGNEPMGLISLLRLAELLVDKNNDESSMMQHVASSSNDPNLRRHQAQPPPRTPVRILFVPIVNIDAYTLNVECGTNQRGNQRDTGCLPAPATVLRQCTPRTRNIDHSFNQTATTMTRKRVPGIDLNRNFPIDWETEWSTDSTTGKCSLFYHGRHFFSEPETQAIRKIVEEEDYYSPTVVAAMSFHSLRSIHRKFPLIIHPYTSKRSISKMPRKDRRDFRRWGAYLKGTDNDNDNEQYKVGTAQEVINYSAGGSTIDWLYGAHGIKSFVFETLPTCDGKWCPASPLMYSAVESYAQVGVRLVELAQSDGPAALHHRRHLAVVLPAFVAILLLLLAVFLILWRQRQVLVSSLRRLVHGKVKSTETEALQPLKEIST